MREVIIASSVRTPVGRAFKKRGRTVPRLRSIRNRMQLLQLVLAWQLGSVPTSSEGLNERDTRNQPIFLDLESSLSWSASKVTWAVTTVV